jgi:hypothetical protein
MFSRQLSREDQMDKYWVVLEIEAINQSDAEDAADGIEGMFEAVIMKVHRSPYELPKVKNSLIHFWNIVDEQKERDEVTG